jgi:hypothetical protein
MPYYTTPVRDTANHNRAAARKITSPKRERRVSVIPALALWAGGESFCRLSAYCGKKTYFQCRDSRPSVND